MIPGASMFDLQQFQRAFQGALPGTVIEVTLRITVPPVDDREPVEATEESTSGAAADSEGPADPARYTPLERLRAAVRAHGGGMRKEALWAIDICRPSDFPARELDRACQAKIIPSEPKTWGKDAGARLISGEDLETYLAMREAVQRGERTAPEWWVEIVSKHHRTAA
jgi:hypothetical protein